MPAKLQNEWRSTAFFTIALVMMVSLFTSRALLSVSTAVFIGLSFFHRQHRTQLGVFLRTPLLWGMSLLFVVPFVSGLWSADKQQWLEAVIVKLPLLGLPIAFASPLHMPRRWWLFLAWIFIGLVTAGTLWSGFHYLADAGQVNEAYLRAKTFLTPLDYDRVRFSWIVCLAALGSGWIGMEAFKQEKITGVILCIISAWLILYLHLLGVRTGILSLYMGVLIIGTRFLMRNKKAGIFFLLAVLVLPLVAYFCIPSFQNRVKYLRYEFDYAKNLDYIPGSTDPVRLISMQAGLARFRANPLTGEGFGDIDFSVHQWYGAHYPFMRDGDKILPSSEYVLYAAGAGIPGLLAILFAVAIPFFINVKRMSWVILNVLVAASFITDIPLEVQYGVFLYGFIVLCCWKWIKDEKV